MKRILLVATILLLPSTALFLFQRALTPPKALGPLATATPAAPDSGQPRLSATDGGIIRLSWVEAEASGGHRLRFSTLKSDGWSEAMTVTRGEDWFVNWADFPSLTAVDEDFLAAHWLVRSGSRSYDYDIHVSISRDGGATWSEPFVLHRDGVAAEHGFVSAAAYRGRLAVAWLDGRNTVAAEGGAMSLRFATLGRAGDVASRAALDERVCDCCQTAIGAVSDGLIVAFRDRSPAEIRDIAVLRFADGAWSEPVTVAGQGWLIAGCPVNGPSVSTRGDNVAVAWHTEADDQPRTLLAFSSDGGRRFGHPLRIDLGDSNGRVDVELLDDGVAAVSWLEGELIKVRRAGRDGTLGSPLTVARVGISRSAGFPQMAVRPGEAVFAWTDPTGEEPQVRTARLPLDRLP